jgi:glucose-1-phosphatase
LLGMRKPDLAIFNYVLTDSKLDPIGTLFVDDSFENIAAAATLGIQTFWIENVYSWNKLMTLLNVN